MPEKKIMAEEIEELGPDCGCEYSQAEYEGMFGCQQNETPSWFRALFRTKQYRKRKVKWDEIKNKYAHFHPTILCDPCATPEAINFSDTFFRHEVTPISAGSLITIACGEVEDALEDPMPGPDGTCREPDEVFRDILGKRAMMQSMGFDDIEECLALEFVITQGLNLPKSDYLPMGGNLQFLRDEELNVVTQECFGKGQCDTMGILRRWANATDCVDGFEGFTDVLIHCDTWEDLLRGDDMQDCLKGFNPRLLLGDLVNNMTGQPIVRQKGVTPVWQSPDGIRFWKVNVQKRYCTETGEIQKYDMMPKNKLIGLNLSGGACSYAPVWGYVPVIDVSRAESGSITTTVNATTRYTKTKVNWHPGGFKQIMQSNMMPFLPYKNSSSCLTICASAKDEVFKLKTDIVPDEVRDENKIQRVIKEQKASEEKAKAEKAAAELEKKAAAEKAAKDKAAEKVKAEKAKAEKAAADKKAADNAESK